MVANPPGAITDVVARLYADALARALGQPIVVDNRPGGDSLIGAEAAARSAPDGSTFFVTSQSFVAIDPHTFKALPVDPERDFAGVAVVVPVAITALNTFEPTVRSGRVRVLAISSPNRVPGWESVPSIVETYPDLDVGGGLVVLAPAGIRTDIVQRLNRETDAVVKSPEFVQRLRNGAGRI